VFSIAPWLAWLTTAYIVSRSTQEHLTWPPLVAWIGAVIVESNGLAAMYLLAKAAKSHNRVAVKLASGLLGAYAGSVIALTVVLDTFPRAAVLAPLFFVVIALSGSGNIVLRQYIVDSRKPHRSAPLPPVPIRVYKNEPVRNAIKIYFQQNPDGTFVGAGKAAGVSHTTASNVYRTLTAEGAISKNGHGG
jgi:hypothetical protein